MNKKIKKQLEEKLKKEKKDLEEQLKEFAKKDDSIEGNWKANFPRYSDGGSSSELDIATEEVEEYANRLSLEHILEVRLLNVNKALKKIKTNSYEECEECGKDISVDRLKASPEAKYCIECKKKADKEFFEKDK